MAGLLDSSMAGLAVTLTGLFGSTGTLKVYSDDTYNPVTGARSETSTTYTVTNAPPEKFSSNEIDGDTIKRGDVKMFIPIKDSRGTALPTLTDSNLKTEFTYQSITYQVKNIEAVASGAANAGYYLQLRK